jgi:hypothetical protein
MLRSTAAAVVGAVVICAGLAAPASAFDIYLDDLLLEGPAVGDEFVPGQSFEVSFTMSSLVPVSDQPDYPDIDFLLMVPDSWEYHRKLEPLDIAVTARTDIKQTVVLTLPHDTVPGDYWIAAVVPSSDGSINPAGVAPPENLNGAFTANTEYGHHLIKVLEGAPCGEQTHPHKACSQSSYCDVEQKCFDCAWCGQLLDAFDGICPTKCGGSATLYVGDSIPDGKTEADAAGAIEDVIKKGCPRYDRLTLNYNPAIIFAAAADSAEPRRMTVSLSDKLDSLAAFVAKHSEVYGKDTSIYVEKSYLAPAAADGEMSKSLHHEARASLVGLHEVTDALVANGWKGCASPGGECACKGWVRYGTGSAYSAIHSASATGVMQCNREVFGDPDPSTESEACECYPPPVATTTSAPASTTSGSEDDNDNDQSVCDLRCTQGEGDCRYKTGNSVLCSHSAYGTICPSGTTKCDNSDLEEITECAKSNASNINALTFIKKGSFCSAGLALTGFALTSGNCKQGKKKRQLPICVRLRGLFVRDQYG